MAGNLQGSDSLGRRELATTRVSSQGFLGGFRAKGLLGPNPHDTPLPPMRDNIRLVSTAGTGFTYYTKKNKRATTQKLEFKKYDPVVRQHVVFKEQKMPPHSK